MAKDLARQYRSALKSYLADGGELYLKQAYLLGREALEKRASTLVVVVAHHQLVASQLSPADLSPERRRQILTAAGQFLAEFLSSFEMAQLGFRESLAELNSLNARLESEVEKRTAAMRESEERYRTLIELSPDAITMTDLNGMIVFCNQHSAELHGYASPAEMADLDAAAHVLPEDLHRLDAMARKVVRQGIIGKSDYTLVRKGGARIPVEVRVSLVRDASGRPAGFLGVNRDVSERIQAQRKLESQARQHTAVADLGQRALSSVELDVLMAETISLVARTLGAEFGELLELRAGQRLQRRAAIGWGKGKPKPEIHLDGDDGQIGFTLRSAAPVVFEHLSQETRFGPADHLLAQGVVAGISVAIHNGRNPYGLLGAYTPHERRFTPDETSFVQACANILAMAIDNRELLETEARARHKAEHDNEIRLKALAIVSHELRTPLTSIKGFASTLLANDVAWGADSQREFIQTIDDEADKLSALIEQMLDLSKMDAGVFRFAFTRQAASSLIEAAMVHLQALSARHKLQVEVPAGLPEVWADPQRVGQVLENLVENATKYSPPGSTITISAQVCEEQLVITVADQGPGIPRREKERVFEAFYRTSGRNTLNSPGAGLGLTICRRLVEAQGGRIWVHDRAKRGAVISFTLPLASSVVTPGE